MTAAFSLITRMMFFFYSISHLIPVLSGLSASLSSDIQDSVRAFIPSFCLPTIFCFLTLSPSIQPPLCPLVITNTLWWFWQVLLHSCFCCFLKLPSFKSDVYCGNFCTAFSLASFWKTWHPGFGYSATNLFSQFPTEVVLSISSHSIWAFSEVQASSRNCVPLWLCQARFKFCRCVRSFLTP